MHNQDGNADPHLNQKKKISCAVVGARGYAGLELCRLLLQHPQVDLTAAFATSEFKLDFYFENPKASAVPCLLEGEVLSRNADLIFLATSAEVSLRLAPLLLAQGRRVIDLSGAFRLKQNDYRKWYGFDHTADKALTQAEFGLCPWVGPSAANLVANPGCYATSILMALLPLLRANLIDPESIVIDAKSGTTGAGKKATESQLFAEVAGNFLPYKVGKHQHYPEILEAAELFAGTRMQAHLSTSLLPVRRGISSAIYLTAKQELQIEDIDQAYKSAYENYPLVCFGSSAENPQLLSMRKVVGTARTHIAYDLDGKRLYVFASIDNLLKGAASQAIENLNRLYDLPLTTGLLQLEAQI